MMRSLCFLLSIWAANAMAQAWVQLPDYPGTARDDAASFHSHAKIHVGTGMDVGFQLTSDWFAYSMITLDWEPMAALPASGRQYCNGFRMSDERGYLFGGLDASGPLNELWRYDAMTDSWTQLTSLPGAGRYASAVMVIGDRAYICGGLLDGGIPTTEVWSYNMLSDTWSPRAAMPGPARHRATTIENLVVGGADSSFQALSDVVEYDPTTDSWTARADLPGPRFGASSVGNLLLCGASSLAQNHNSIFQWDRQNDSWLTSGTPPFPGGPRKGGISATQTYIADIGVIFYGLGIDGPVRSSDWWRLDFPVGMNEARHAQFTMFPNPASDQFTLGNLPERNEAICTVLDGLGRVVLEQAVGIRSTIGTTHLPPGRYLVRISSGDQLLHAPLIILR
jgi:hypothetical protein